MADKTDVIDHAEFRELAEAAKASWEGTVEDGGGSWFSASVLCEGGHRLDDEDAAFVAAASPDVIIALLDEVVQAREACRIWQDCFNAKHLEWEETRAHLIQSLEGNYRGR